MPKRDYKTEAIKLSNSDNWRTPQWLFDQLNQEFNFKIDLCADDNNTKRYLYYSLQNDALAEINQWDQTSFANVPYSRAKPFLIKAYEQSRKHHVTIVILLRVDTSNNWWYEHVVQKASETRFIVGRLWFWDETNQPHYSAKWANAILVYGPDYYEGSTVSWWKYKEGQTPTCDYSFRMENNGY